MSNIFTLFTARKRKPSENIPPKKLKIEAESDADSDDDDEAVKVKNKRKRSAIIDSDSDYENDENDENESDNSQSVDEKPTRKKSNGNSTASKKIKLSPSDTKISLEEKLKAKNDQSRSLSDVKENESADILDVPVVWRHQKLDFLYPAKILDAQKRRPDHPNYDPTTLFVPISYLDSLTPVSGQLHMCS